MRKYSGLEKIGIALMGLAAGRLGFGAARAYSEDKKEPFKLEAIKDYRSHRNAPKVDGGKCYEGVPFSYDGVLKGGFVQFVQSDEQGVHIIPIWAYDIDNDGKIGEAEEKAIKKGIPIYMHEEFNKKANEAVRNQFLKHVAEYRALKEEYESLSETSRRDKEEIRKYQEKVNKLEAGLKKEGQALGLGERELMRGVHMPDVPKEEKPVVESLDQRKCYLPPRDKKKGDQTQSPSGEERNLYFIGQVKTNFSDIFGAGLGLGIGNEKLRIDATADFALGLDKNKDSYNDVLGAGLRASGSVIDTNRWSIGGKLGARIGITPEIGLDVGAGLDYIQSITKSKVNIFKNDELMKSNIDSIPNRRAFAKIYGGLEAGTKNLKARADLEYSVGNGLSLNTGVVIR